MRGPPDSGEVNSFNKTGASGFECPQHLEGFGGIGTDRVVRIHISGTNESRLIDHVSRGHRQSVFRLVVEPGQGATERLIEVAQVIRQHERNPKLLRQDELRGLEWTDYTGTELVIKRSIWM